MFKSLSEDFQEFIYARCDKSGEELMKNDEYSNITKQAINLFNQIRDLLPEDKQELLFELESTEGHLSALAQGQAYKLGLKEGLEFRELLKLTS